MASSWFDQDYYLEKKAAYNNANSVDGKTDWTAATVLAAIEAAGFTAEAHYSAVGWTEGLAPNPYYNEEFYINSKVAQLNADAVDGRTDWTAADFKAAWGVDNNPFQHYLQYGAFEEGVNPSANFDDEAYYTAKAEQLNAIAFEGKSDWTVADVKTAFQAAGLDPISHWEAFGKNEDLSYQPSIIGVSLALTTADDIFTPDAAVLANRTTADDDTITGVSSSLTSERTLNPGDQIDGGAGNDTLKVSMLGSFSGFSGDGYMKNVETVELTNAGAIARTFAAKGVEGVESYILNGAISLSDLATTSAAVTLKDRASGVTTIGYASEVTDGKADALALGLSNVGTAEVKDADGKVTTAEAAVTVTAAGIEEVNISTVGTNVVALGANDAKALTAAGAGSLKFTAIGTGVKTINASTMAGDLDVALDDATGVTSILAGSGADIIRAGADDLAVNAEINGGSGADTLALTGAIGTVQYQMSGVETVEIDAVMDMTFSAANATGLANVVVKGAGNNVLFANMGSADLAVGLNKAAAGEITSDNAGAATLTVSGGTKAAPTTALVDTTFTKAGAVDVTVEQYNTLGDGKNGNIVADKALSFTAAIAGAMDNTVTLATATSAVFSQTNKDETVAVNLQAAKVNDLQVTTAGDFTVDGASILSAVEGLTVNTAKHFNATGVALGKVSSLDLSGSGNDAQVTLGALGDGALDYGITLNAEGLKAGLITGKIDTGAGQSVSVNVAGVMGAVTTGDITVAKDAGKFTGSITIDADGTAGNIELGALSAKTVTVNAAGALGTVGAGATIVIDAETASFTGSALKANKVDMTVTKSGTAIGGIAADLIVVSGDAAAGAKATFTLTGGLGADEFNISTGTGATVATIADFTLTVDDVAGVVVGDLADITEANAALVLKAAFGGTFVEGNITLKDLGTNQYAVGYAGSTYLITGDGDGVLDDGEIVIKLDGVNLANVTTATDIFA